MKGTAVKGAIQLFELRHTFEAVGKAVGKSGNPNAQNLFTVTRYLQKNAGLIFKVETVASKRAKAIKNKQIVKGWSYYTATPHNSVK